MPAVSSRLVRVLKIGALVGIAVGAVRALRGSPPPPTGAARWLPLTDPKAAEPRQGPVQFTATPPAAVGGPWVAPIDGACPPGHPIKAKAASGIFHVPGGLSYDRTSPDRCYATEAAAEADGFRRAKR